MAAWERHGWVDEATEATIAVVGRDCPNERELLRALGPVDARGDLSFDDALRLQAELIEDGTFHERAVFQAAALPGGGRQWWVIVEPNGFRLSMDGGLLTVAGTDEAASFFWNVNAVMSLLRVNGGRTLADFDPLLDVDYVPEHGRDLPFGERPGAASLALIERWTGVVVGEDWFAATKPTFVVHVPEGRQ
jgi:Family of unknown function (DUF6461)